MKPRLLTALALPAIVAVGYLSMNAWDTEFARADGQTHIGTAAVYADQLAKEYGEGLIRVNGHGAEWHRWQRVKAERRADELQRRLTARVLQVRSLRRTLAHDPNVIEALNLAAAVYGHGSTLWRKAQCESHLNPNAKNRSSSAAGLLQFLDSTWASTPFAAFSVYSPYANALAGGWMHDVGRGGEWVCQ